MLLADYSIDSWFLFDQTKKSIKELGWERRVEEEKGATTNSKSFFKKKPYGNLLGSRSFLNYIHTQNGFKQNYPVVGEIP